MGWCLPRRVSVQGCLPRGSAQGKECLPKGRECLPKGRECLPKGCLLQRGVCPGGCCRAPCEQNGRQV